VDGTVTMRKRDHTIVNYAAEWGVTQPKFPWVTSTTGMSWDKIEAQENEFLKSKGWI
jgi:hypothetical protein